MSGASTPGRLAGARGFARTLVLGALAAVTLPLSVRLLESAFGGAGAVGAHAVLATAVHLALLAPAGRRRARVLIGALTVGGLSWALAGSLGGLFAALSVVVAVTRSGLLFRRGPARAVVVEGLVAATALALWHVLAGPHLLAQSLALWGWFVGQSFYFLPAGLARRGRRRQGDAFERARQRVEELLGS